MGSVSVVVGGLYGSESKGAVCAEIVRDEAERARRMGHPEPSCVRVSGPNAGHTAIDGFGQEWKLRQVPVGAVWSNGPLYIGQQSEIDLPVLLKEIAELDKAGYGVSSRLTVDAQATMLTDEHKKAEAEGQLVSKIGSTGKGIGAARAARIMRKASLAGDPKYGVGEGIMLGHTPGLLADDLRSGAHVNVEAAQGFALGLHAGHYPQCTSNNSRIIDSLAYAGISPWAQYVTKLDPWVVLRTFPIRVAGNSGPLQDEVTWDQLTEESGGHIMAERTTVTNKIRRVGRWDPDLARRAVEANGGGNGEVRVALAFLDYVFPDLANSTDSAVLGRKDVAEYLEAREAEIGATIDLVGFGPASYIWRNR